MFTAREVMDVAKNSFLANLSLKDKDNVVLSFVNLGVSELFRRFNLSIKVETVITNPNLALYELRNPDVSLLLGVYDKSGKELMQTDILGGKHDYKLVNYKSFLLRNPRDGMLFAVYKASPTKLTSTDEVVPLPDSMMDALLTYIAYIGHSTINKDNILESSAYTKRFDQACNELENQGYRIPLNNETIDLRLRGFI